MAIQVCTILFRDGASVCARIRASFPDEESPVKYSGAIDRLPFRYKRADAIVLRAVFRSFARELSAQFSEELLGAWELKAESQPILPFPPAARTRKRQ